jgi:nucleolar protein 56
VQILGAEKALFRALKTKGNTPKYGLIYHSTFIGRAEAKNKGRISRYLANKCSIATRIDSFSDNPSRLYGEKLRDQVEERLKFYETGAAPRKNVDVMEEVARELAAGKSDDIEMRDAETPKSKKEKKKKKDKKRKAEEVEESFEDETAKKLAKKAAKKAKKEVATSAEKTPDKKEAAASAEKTPDKKEAAASAEKKSDKKKKKKKSKE